MNRLFKAGRTLATGFTLVRTWLVLVNEKSRKVWQGMKDTNPWGLR